METRSSDGNSEDSASIPGWISVSSFPSFVMELSRPEASTAIAIPSPFDFFRI